MSVKLGCKFDGIIQKMSSQCLQTARAVTKSTEQIRFSHIFGLPSTNLNSKFVLKVYIFRLLGTSHIPENIENISPKLKVKTHHKNLE